MDQNEIKQGIISLVICQLRGSGLLIEDRSRGINNRTYTFSEDFDLLTVLASLSILTKQCVSCAKEYLKYRFDQILSAKESCDELNEIVEKLK